MNDEYEHHWHEERVGERSCILAVCLASVVVIIILSVLS
jgi:hypothetical protein